MYASVTPYLFFEGRAEEALEFYKQALGAEIGAVMRNQDSPEPAPPGMLPPGSEKKVMHAEFRIKDTLIMASDGNCSGQPKFAGISLTYPASDAAEAQKAFAALSDGGHVQMPLMKTFFSESFGMVADKFGVGWMVIVPMPHTA